MGLLDGQVALITAAGGGIGTAIALRFAAEGARVGCADLSADGAEATAAKVRAAGGEAIAVGADALQAGDCERMVQTVTDRFGGPHVLCNLVGYFGPRGSGSLDQIDLAAWHWMMDINLKSVFLASKYAIPAILRSGGGAIVNTGTVAAVIGRPIGVAYGASKSGVLSLTRAMAAEYQQLGIRVNCVCPSATDTAMYWGATQQPRDEVLRSVQGLSSPAEIAEVFLFLASPMSARVTGHILMADFGFTAFRL